MKFKFTIIFLLFILVFIGCSSASVKKDSIDNNVIIIGNNSVIDSYPKGTDFSVKIVDFPNNVDLGEEFNITWEISGQKNAFAQSTLVLYDNFSIKSLDRTVYNHTTKSLSDNVPKRFSGVYAIETYGKMYFRVYAVIDGKEYWSSEQNLVVNPPKSQPKSSSVKQFKIELDDSGFYPKEDLVVNKGDNVYIEFFVRTYNVNSSGMRVIGKDYDSGKIIPGQKSSVQFNAFDSFSFSSFWPSSNSKRSELKVVVN